MSLFVDSGEVDEGMRWAGSAVRGAHLQLMVMNLQPNPFIFLCVIWCPVLMPTNSFQQRSQLEPKTCLLWESSVSAGSAREAHRFSGCHRLLSWHLKGHKKEAVA